MHKMGAKEWILCFTLFAASPLASASGLRRLFPDSRSYLYDVKCNVSTGSLLPAQGGSHRTLRARLELRAINHTTLVLHTHAVETTVYDRSGKMAAVSQELPSQAQSLHVPWIANYSPESGMLHEVLVSKDEPVWSANVKKALAISLQLVGVNNSDVTHKSGYTVLETCLHGACAVEYSGVDTNTVRKWHGVPTSVPGLGRTAWSSVRPDSCSNDVKQPFIGNAERVYELDDRGLVSLQLDSSLEYHTHGHLLTVITGMSLSRIQISQSDLETVPQLVPSGPAYSTHSYKEKTNTRAPVPQVDLLEKTRVILTEVSECIDDANVTQDADQIHSMKLIDLHDTMSQLNLESLKRLNNELHVGTSYLNETNKNIFLEVLPHIKSADSAKLVKFLVTDFNEFKLEEATALSLIRKLPFNVKEYSQELLVHMEDLLNMPPDVARELRHASILSFATLVFQTYVNGACSADEFDGYVQKYFRMYTECPKYEDRMVWLQGLANLQVGSVSSYLRPIIQDKRVSRHERFLAIWATLPVAHFKPEMTSSLYWPILTDSSEHLQLRVAALLTLLHGDQSPSRVLSLDRYVSGCGDGSLKKFWYTTVKSLHKSSYGCFSTLSKLLSYVSGLVQKPDEKFWATANRIVDVSDHERQYAAMSQLLTVSKPHAGHPEFFYLSLNSNQAGLATSQISIMMKAEGVKEGLLDPLFSLSAANFTSQELLQLLKEMRVDFRAPQPIHLEVIINIQGKTVFATHVNQSLEHLAKLDSSWLRTILDILNSESHINQQFVQYPLQTERELPTELGTPVTLQTTWSSFLSVRGTMTSPANDYEWIRKNDIHLRYHGTAVTRLSSYGPTLSSEHSVRIQQSTLAHLPLKFDLRISAPNFVFSWLNDDPTGGVVIHSRTQVATRVGEGVNSASLGPGSLSEYTVRSVETASSQSESEFFFDCERPMTTVELLEKILDTNRANHNFFSSPRPTLLLVHLLYLLSVPPPGSCGLLVRSGFPFHLAPATRLDLALQADWDSEDGTEFEKLAFEVSWRDEDIENTIEGVNATEPQTERLNVKGLIRVDFSDQQEHTYIKVIGVDQDQRNWQFCLKHNQTNDMSDDLDLTLRPLPYRGRVVAAYSRVPSVDCSGGIELQMDYSGTTNVSLEATERLFRLQVSAVNDPRKSGFNLPRILTSSTSDALKTNVSQDNLERLTEAISILDRNGQTVITNNYLNPLRFTLGDLAEQLDQFTLTQILRKFGLYQECHILERTARTFDGSVTELHEIGRPSLVLAECTAAPRFGIFRNKDGSFIFYSGDTKIMLTPQFELTVDGVEATFPYSDNNFQVKRREAVAIVLFKLKYLEVHYRPAEVTILVADRLVDVSCGVCNGDHLKVDF